MISQNWDALNSLLDSLAGNLPRMFDYMEHLLPDVLDYIPTLFNQNWLSELLKSLTGHLDAITESAPELIDTILALASSTNETNHHSPCEGEALQTEGCWDWDDHCHVLIDDTPSQANCSECGHCSSCSLCAP